ncbi:hypothetical protein [Polyangium spumosum]|uniref:hypothetical protein n=1 Tax=Polyangium spumosum TaxID=889282 RepID=UPI00129A53FB|nr:hypothetical protein [Polyangium spumosum]
MLDVHVTESGEVREAKVRESLLGDREIEACMERALAGMTVPASVTGVHRFTRPDSVGRVAPQARAPMGNVVVLGGAVNLVPVLIVAAGVTFTVVVTVYVSWAKRSRRLGGGANGRNYATRCSRSAWKIEDNRTGTRSMASTSSATNVSTIARTITNGITRSVRVLELVPTESHARTKRRAVCR